MLICKECRKNEKAPGRSRCWSCYTQYRKGTPKPVGTEPTNQKVLLIDIETQPNLGYVWGLFKQNIGINQIKESGEVMCFAAKWLGDNEDDSIMFFHGWEDRMSMLEAAHRLLDEADVVVGYYSSRFDIPWLFTEFVTNGFTPPSPFKQVDLKQAVAKTFNFTSNKLQYVSKALGLAGKVEHEGFDLWTKCMFGDEEARLRMQEYNEQDVLLLEDLLEVLIPWIPNLPSRHLYDGISGCPHCGVEDKQIEQKGYAYTKVSRFRRFRCTNCGSYFRESKRIDGCTMQSTPLC